MKHPVSDLVTYVFATHEAGQAFSAMHEAAAAGNASTLDRLHRLALAAAHRKAAAAATLGIDDICPHPRDMAAVWEQTDAAKVSIYHLRKEAKKNHAN